MRDANRIHLIIEELEKAWHKSGWEDMRFGQFLTNIIGDLAHDHKIQDIWFPEDDKWLQWLKEWNGED